MPLPKSITELKANIERETKNISQDDLSLVFGNFRKRMELVISAEAVILKINDLNLIYKNRIFFSLKYLTHD